MRQRTWEFLKRNAQDLWREEHSKKSSGRKQNTHRLCPQDSVCKLIRSLTDKHSPSGTLASFINYFFFFCAYSRSLNLLLSCTDKEQREMKGVAKWRSRCSPCLPRAVYNTYSQLVQSQQDLQVSTSIWLYQTMCSVKAEGGVAKWLTIWVQTLSYLYCAFKKASLL